MNAIFAHSRGMVSGQCCEIDELESGLRRDGIRRGSGHEGSQSDLIGTVTTSFQLCMHAAPTVTAIIG